MIVVRLMGGLGNQMFQYAAGRAVAARNRTKLELDITSYDNMAEIDTPRQYELNVFAINAEVADMRQVETSLEESAKPQRFTDRLFKRLGWSKISEGEKSITQIADNSYLVGWWQNQDNFLDVRNLLLEEFEPTNEPRGANKDYLAKIVNSESISIHVRRGDYVNNVHANAFHGITPLEYYTRAINLIKEKLEHPVFFVFSDDLDWCKKELPLGDNAIFVSGNEGKRAFEDIRLMKNCKHNIIANSSFSWWGAWLNSNKDKLVIAPQAWFQDPQANAETKIVPPEWIRI